MNSNEKTVEDERSPPQEVIAAREALQMYFVDAKYSVSNALSMWFHGDVERLKRARLIVRRWEQHLRELDEVPSLYSNWFMVMIGGM